LVDLADSSVANAAQLRAAFAANPTGPFPLACASSDQLGFRVPFIAVSPFSKPGYVSHNVSDHISVLALIEKRFMVPFTPYVRHDHPHLTRRDQSPARWRTCSTLRTRRRSTPPSARWPRQPTIAGRSQVSVPLHQPRPR
jgi:Phosphoesterase family